MTLREMLSDIHALEERCSPSSANMGLLPNTVNLEASAFSKLLYFRIGGFLEEEEWNQDYSKEQSNAGGPPAHDPQ